MDGRVAPPRAEQGGVQAALQRRQAGVQRDAGVPPALRVRRRRGDRRAARQAAVAGSQDVRQLAQKVLGACTLLFRHSTQHENWQVSFWPTLSTQASCAMLKDSNRQRDQQSKALSVTHYL
jgi:hypothetical protein